MLFEMAEQRIPPGFLLALPVIVLALHAAPAKLSYVDLSGGKACCLVPDAAGNMYVIGSVGSATGTKVSVTRLNASHQVVFSFAFGGGLSDQPNAAVMDPEGNLVIAGQTNSPDFPLVNALISQTEPNAPAGFIAKVNPATGQILFSTRIGGVATQSFARIGTAVNAVATDPAGNIYAAGTTAARDFPVTATAFQKTGAGGDAFGPRPFGFVVKLTPAGDRFLYATLLGGLTANCVGGSHCIGKNASTSVNALVVDRNGIATVAGATNAPDFPVTAGVVQTVCRCQEYANNGFVTQFNTTGSALRWSTFLGGSWYGFSQVPTGTNTIVALGQDNAGNVFVAGRTDAADFPVTAGVLQPGFASAATQNRRSTDGFLSKLNPTGTALLYSTYMGGTAEDGVTNLHVNSGGSVWVTGNTASNDFPGNSAAFTGSFFAQVSTEGTRLIASQRTPTGAAGQAIVASSDVTVLGEGGSILRAPADLSLQTAVFGFASTFGGSVKPYVSPGEFVSLYGTQLGPITPEGAALDGEGRIANRLAGIQVLFDGIAAPLLYASHEQVNALVPYGVGNGAKVRVVVSTPAGTSPEVELHVRSAQPEVFNVGGTALAVNQDNSINSPENPAAPGSVVSLFASGAGRLYSLQPEGSIPAVPAATPVLPVAVLLDNRSVEVLYAGNAPGLVQNVLQINVRVPAVASSGLWQLMVGGTFSAPFTISVR